MKRSRTIPLVALALAGTIGCGGGAAPTTSNAPTTAPSTPASPMPSNTTVTSGGSTASTGSVPSDFPKDVPVYAGATVVSAASQGGTNYGAVLSTADAPEAVATYYKDELVKNGWSTPQIIAAGGTNVMRATKDKRQCAVTITKGADGKTNVNLGITATP